MDYTTAKAFLEQGRSKTYRPLTGRSSSMILHSDGSISVRYHDTDVVTWRPDGDIVLDSGGWRSVTTKARINEYAPCYVTQHRGLWTVHYGENGSKQSYTFADGMVLKRNGKVVGAGRAPEKHLKLRKQVNQFAKDFVKALRDGKVPEPSAGDCWFCSMHVVEGSPNAGKSLGEAFKDKDHILGHIKEKYYVPSLLMNALKSMGASQAAYWAIGGVWGKNSGFDQEFIWTRITKSLRRYILKELGEVY